MSSGRFCKVAIKKESSYGTYTTPDMALSILKENLGLKLKTEKDGRLMGTIAPSDSQKVGEKAEGSPDLSVHPREIGPIINLALMKNASPSTSPEATLAVVYVGTDAYSSLTLAVTTLTGKSGATQGTASPAFALDLSTTPYDTVAELAAAINAVAGSNWKAYVFGYGASLCSNFATFTETQMHGAYFMFSLSASTTSKMHKITPALVTDPELSFSYCADRTFGTGKAMGYSGVKINTLSLKADAQKIVSMALGLVAKAEEIDKTYPAVSLPDDHAFTGDGFRVLFGGYEWSVAKNIALNLNNNFDNSEILGSIHEDEPLRQECSAEISGSLNMVIADRDRDYPKFSGMTAGELLIYMENVDYADTTNHVKYSVLIRIPSVKLSQYEVFPSGPARLTASIAGAAIANSYYDHIEVYVVDVNTSAY